MTGGICCACTSWSSSAWRYGAISDGRCSVDERSGVVHRHLLNLRLFSVYDSWGKTPAGLQRGNSFTPGSFEQCREFSVHNSAASFDGQHCTVRLNLNSVESSLNELWIGICVPDSCEARFVQRMVDSFAVESSFGKVSSFRQEDFCYRDDPNWSLSGTAIAAMYDFF